MFVLTLYCALFIIAVLRLAYIQLIGTESFSSNNINLIKQSIQQRQQQIILHSGRGDITDRNGYVLTGEKTHVLVLFPLIQHSDITDEALTTLTHITGVSEERIIERMEKIREPYIFKTGPGILHITEHEAETINRLNITGIVGLPFETRYSKERLVAAHLIGRIGENPEWVKEAFANEIAQGTLSENSKVGISGLERTFQPFLQGIGPTTLAFYVDGKGRPMEGMDIKYYEHDNPFYPLSIQSTLDLTIQQQLENVLDNRHVSEGTAVILDIETSEIIAMATRPRFSLLDPVDQSWRNKALTRYTPGSVFKVVIAAAALENGLTDFKEQYHCDGKIEGTDFHCWKEAGHGTLTFEEAFAQSCNIVFGNLATQLGSEQIEEYAEKLGLLEPNGWSTEQLFYLDHFQQLEGEEVGQVIANARTEEEIEDINYLLRTGIGQVDVQVTPLAVANMMATIAKGGFKHETKAVNEINYATGGLFHRFPAQKMTSPTISPYTAYQLQRLLAGVPEYGTASHVLGDKPWKVAGKTGTAETKINRAMSPSHNHQWFAGYYPQQKPRYAIAVLTLNQPSHSRNVSVDVFADIVNWLYSQEKAEE